MAEAAALAPPPAPQGQKLDELMPAMDVVDTLRHQENLVARELDETSRDADLLERLRRIYRGQGIAVPDRVLEEGVRALKESRFVYAPPPEGLSKTLATLWVEWARYGRGFLSLIFLLLFGYGLYHMGVVRPAQQRAEQARVQAERERIELTPLLPRALEQRRKEVLTEAKVPEARERADRILADGRAALARNNAEGARDAIGALEDLRSTLRQEYTLRIVSRPREPT